MTTLDARRPPRRALTNGALAIQQLARWSKDVRQLLGLSQETVARESGLSQGGVSRVESGRGTSTPLVTFLALSRYYHAKAVMSGVELPDPLTLLREPETFRVPELDPTRVAILRGLDEGPAWRRHLLAELALVVLRRRGEDDMRPHEVAL